MQYLVRMNLVASSRPATPQEGVSSIEQFILPTLDMCKKFQEDKRIIAGGPVSGTVALVLLIRADSEEELDDLLTGLPIWSRMETEMIPLNTFEARVKSPRPRLDQLKAQARDARSSVGGTR